MAKNRPVSIIERAAAKIGTVRKRQNEDAAVVDPGRSSKIEILAGVQAPDAVPSGTNPESHSAQILAADNYQEIDLEALKVKGFCTPNEPRSAQALEFRRIKRPLLLNIKKYTLIESCAKRPNLIMVTSALPNEGKTFVAINLAISIAAELDKRVVLVDGDVTKGDVTSVLSIQYQAGLSELLAEEVCIAEDLVVHTNIDHLSVLPSGRPNPHIDELYASDMMARIVNDLAENDPDRVIIFDAPPLLATTEAGVLANLMGQILMVVEADKTPQSAVKDALVQLEGIESVSMVLNKTSRSAAESYGYSYGYGYSTAT